MKKLLPFVFLVLKTAFMYSQNGIFDKDTINYKPGIQITWNDFKGDILEYSHLSGSFFSGIAFNNIYSKRHGLSYNIHAYMDRKQSWHKVMQRSNDGLLYYQTIFDMNYYLAKSAFINACSDSSFMGNSFLDEYQKANYESDLLLKRFEKVSNNGQEKKVVELWSDSIKAKISRIDSLKFIQLYHPTSMSITLGALQPIFYSGINDYASISTMGSMGIDFIIKKILLSMDLNFGGSKIKKEFKDGDFVWTTDRKPGSSLIAIQTGYAINKDISLCYYPTFTFGTLALSIPENKDKETKAVNTEGFLIGGGFLVDYYYNAKKTTRMSHFIPNRALGLFRFRLMAGYTKINSELSGVMLNVGCCWGFALKKVYRRYY